MKTFYLNIQSIIHKSIISETSLWVVLIIALNLLVKMQNLSEASIWFDESHTMFLAQKSIPEILDVAGTDQNPPLYNIVSHYWISCLGNTESSIRSLSLFFNIIASVLLFLFATRNLNFFSAVTVSIFFILSNEIIYYAREARSYSMILSLCVASAFIFSELFKKPEIWKIILLAIVNALLLYTHYLTFFFLIVEGMVALFFIQSNRKAFVNYFFSQIAAFLLFTPWLSVAFSISNKTQQGFWLSSPSINELYDVFARFGMTYQIRWLSFWLIIACFIWMLIIRRKQFEYSQKIIFLFLLLWGFFPILADYYIASFIPVFLPRYILYALPGLMLLVAYSISMLPLGNIIRVVLVAYIAGASYKEINMNPYKGEDWRNAMIYFKNIKTLDAAAIYCAPYLFPAITYYYNKDYFTDYKNTVQKLESEKIFGLNNIYELKEDMINSKDDIILIESHIDVADKNRTIHRQIEKNYFVKKQAGFGGIDITLFSALTFFNHTTDSIFFSDKHLLTEKTDSFWINTSSLQIRAEATDGMTSVTNNHQQYGLTWRFDNQNKEISAGDIICFSFDLYSTENINWSGFNVSFTDESGRGLYFSKPLKNFYNERNKWQKIIYNIQMPEGYSKSDLIKAFFQNNDGTEILIDNVSVRVLKQK